MSHAKIAELTPWYVNGTLDLAERQATAVEVASCDACAADVDELTKIQAAMLELEAMTPEPSEHGLSRALDAVEAEEEKKRLGHPWLGWWWALTPFRRALAVSAALGAIVALGVFVAPKPVLAPTSFGAPDMTMPVTLESSNANRLTERSAPLMAPNPMTASNGAAAADSKSVPASDATMESLSQIARTGSVSVLVPDVEEAIGHVSSVARAHGGEVLSLDDRTPTQPGERHMAQLEVGVPERGFEPTIDAVSKLGGLQSKSVSAENVATQIVDTQARLRNLQATEADLLRIMGRSGKIDDVLAVEQQVSATRDQIEQLDATVQALQHRVAMSTIAVALEDSVPTTSAEIGMGAQLGNTWASAVHSVQAFTVTLLGAALWAVAYGPYLLGLLLVVGLVAIQRQRP